MPALERRLGVAGIVSVPRRCLQHRGVTRISEHHRLDFAVEGGDPEHRHVRIDGPLQPPRGTQHRHLGLGVVAPVDAQRRPSPAPAQIRRRQVRERFVTDPNHRLLQMLPESADHGAILRRDFIDRGKVAFDHGARMVVRNIDQDAGPRDAVGA